MRVDLLENNRAKELTIKLDEAGNLIKKLNDNIKKLSDEAMVNHYKMIGMEADKNNDKVMYESKIRQLESKIESDVIYYESLATKNNILRDKINNICKITGNYGENT